jgi:hypothetical protein
MGSPRNVVLEGFRLGRICRGRREFRIVCRGSLELCGAPNAASMAPSGWVLGPLEIEFIINGNINDKWQSAGNASPFRVGWL